MGLFARLVLRLPEGIAEDVYEFLLSISLGFVGVVDFIVPAFKPHSLTNALPWWLALAWGAFLFVGGVVCATGILLRGQIGFQHAPRTVESIGLVLLGAAVLSYGIVDFSIVISRFDLGALGVSLLLLAIGLGLLLRAVVLTPGVYEHVLAREMEREMRRSLQRK